LGIQPEYLAHEIRKIRKKLDTLEISQKEGRTQSKKGEESQERPDKVKNGGILCTPCILMNLLPSLV